MAHTVGHQFPGQENHDVTARVRRADQAAHERAGLPHLIGPARERHAFPNRHSSHQHTPFPPATPPGRHRAAGRAHGDARSTQPRTSSRTRPRTGHPRAMRGPDPGQQAATHTAPWPLSPSAICPWSPQHRGLQRPKVTHGGTEQKRPASPTSRSQRAVFAGCGRWWIRTTEGEADGFTARSPWPRWMRLTSVYTVRGSVPGRRRPLCVRAARVPGAVRRTDEHGRRWRERYADRPGQHLSR